MYGYGQYWVVCPAPRYVYVAPATETNISGCVPLEDVTTVVAFIIVRPLPQKLV